MNNTSTVWTARETSSWGVNDPDIWRPYILPKELVKYLDADEEVKDKANFAADRIKDELETALAHFQTITTDEFTTFNLSRQRAAYESLYSDLWTLYKDRSQQYLKAIGIDIGFMFAEDNKNFNKYTKVFVANHPDNADFVQFAKLQRDSWQNDLSKNRNAHEHHGDLRKGVKEFDNPADATRLFAQVCWTMETIIANLVSWKLEKLWNVIENNRESTVFDRVERFTIEHAFTTQQREKKR
ncbi:MAG: hypothetical protein WBK76_05055 [Candidatus Saccharimonadales bacterium]|nr:hypothetical protein [Patescibacteria group bacterium]